MNVPHDLYFYRENPFDLYLSQQTDYVYRSALTVDVVTEFITSHIYD